MDLVSLLASTGLLTAILAQLVRAVRAIGRLEARVKVIETHVAGIELALADARRAVRDEARHVARDVARSITAARCAALERRLVELEVR